VPPADRLQAWRSLSILQQGQIGPDVVFDLVVQMALQEVGEVAAERVNPFETACSPDSCHSFS
jgi:hypothetical protein